MEESHGFVSSLASSISTTSSQDRSSMVSQEGPSTGCSRCNRRSQRWLWRRLSMVALVAIMGATTSTSVYAQTSGGETTSRGGNKNSIRGGGATRMLTPPAPAQPKAKQPAGSASVPITHQGNVFLSKTPGPLAISPDNKVRGTCRYIYIYIYI